MNEEPRYCKRLIEVDLPIKRISAHARREKSIQHGHISALHIWWARRPLAACRAVLCASLWPDPVDQLCPEEFKSVAKEEMLSWATKHISLLSADSFPRFVKIQKDATLLNDDLELRKALLDFIADFSNWDNSVVAEYLASSSRLTQVAHESMGGITKTLPMVIDPFAGGGAIPLEALRIGTDAFASDLNPVAVLLNKVVLEYIPKYRGKLAESVRKYGEWIKKEAEKELEVFYPKDPDGSIPIAYLWARTIHCEGPGCGAEVPLIRSLWLSKRKGHTVALKMIPNSKRKIINFEIIENAKIRDVGEGTVKRGSATCPFCGYTTSVASVRKQLSERHGGAEDARLFCVVTNMPGQQGRFYRLPTQHDYAAVKKAKLYLEKLNEEYGGEILVPNEPLPPQGTLGFRVQLYGMKQWGDLFSSRQALSLIVFLKILERVDKNLFVDNDINLLIAIKTILALLIDSMADHNSSLCSWRPVTLDVSHVFGRQALPMTWDFAETIPIGDSTGSPDFLS